MENPEQSRTFFGWVAKILCGIGSFGALVTILNWLVWLADWIRVTTGLRLELRQIFFHTAGIDDIKQKLGQEAETGFVWVIITVACLVPGLIAAYVYYRLEPFVRFDLAARSLCDRGKNGTIDGKLLKNPSKLLWVRPVARVLFVIGGFFATITIPTWAAWVWLEFEHGNPFISPKEVLEDWRETGNLTTIGLWLAAYDVCVGFSLSFVFLVPGFVLWWIEKRLKDEARLQHTAQSRGGFTSSVSVLPNGASVFPTW